MNTSNIERYLESFGKYIVQQSRTNLTKKRKNVNKALYNSIRFTISKDYEGFVIKFYMLDYGKFVDKGVSGFKKIQEYTTYDGRKVASPFQYNLKQPPPEPLSKWIKQRGLKPKGLGRGRDKKTGRFISNLAFLIGRKIRIRGIKSTSFFQRPLMLGLEGFGKDLLGAVKEDIINNLTTVR